MLKAELALHRSCSWLSMQSCLGCTEELCALVTPFPFSHTHLILLYWSLALALGDSVPACNVGLQVQLADDVYLVSLLMLSCTIA